MKIKNKAIVIAGICLITGALSACSQMGTERNDLNDARQNMQTQGFGGNDLVNSTSQLREGNMTGIQNMGPNMGMNQTNGQQTASDRKKAENIKRQLKMMDGIEDVNVIVSGNTALVGIKSKGAGMTGNMGNTGNAGTIGNTGNIGSTGNTGNVGNRNSISNMGNATDMTSMKSKIQAKVKEIDRTITNVTVSESSDIMGKMNELVNGTKNMLGKNTNNSKQGETFADEFNKLMKGMNTTR